MSSDTKKLIFFICIFLIIIIIIYLGLSEFYKKNLPDLTEEETTFNKDISESTKTTETTKPPPVEYSHFTETVNGYIQQIHILEIDIQDSRAKIKPVLSFDKVFGFEKLSEMSKRNDAYAAINGGFFYNYGQPSGMVVINGKMYSNSTGKYPVFVISQESEEVSSAPVIKASFQEIQTKLWVNCNNEKIQIDNINIEGKPGEVILYTPEYGSGNRVKYKNLTIIVRNNIVEKVVEINDEAKIPEDGMLITFIKPLQAEVVISPGTEVEFEFEPFINADSHAYECGSWVVKDGQVVIGDRDDWVGTMNNRDPRTAIGIKEDGKVVLFVVDGRQPGFSYGLKGSELGEVLLKYGVVNAAMLDGGASTEMLINHELVNKPSFKGEERPLAGGILVHLRN